MKWRRMVRAMWPFGRPTVPRDDSARQAMLAADASQLRAAADQERARRLRADSEQVADKLAAHNTANRYDDWIRKVVQGRE